MNRRLRFRFLLVSVLAARAASGAEHVPLPDWPPLPSAEEVQRSLPDDAKLARQALLGPGATDPAFVTLWWYGVSSFVAAAGGHLFLFDAWEIVGAHANYSPIGREDLAALRPEVIFVGHGHFDHAADAGYVAGRSGAVVVGSEEICATAESDAARDGNENAFRCLVTGTATTPSPGTVQSVRVWSDLPKVHVLQHLHSASRPQYFEPTTFLPFPNLLPFLQHPNTDPEELVRFLESGGDPQGGTWAYHLRVADFTLLWHDSAGPIVEGEPGAAEIRQALDSLPGCVDVHSGAILGFDQPFSGLRDPRLYVEHAHPRLFLPSHHDAWAPVIAAGGAAYQDEWAKEMAKLEHPPVVDFLRDPEDYMKRRRYAVGAEIWKRPMPGSSCAR
ncbi:MAG: MBL fold metallo-hydrolase [Candidatus Binatia bacterium]